MKISNIRQKQQDGFNYLIVDFNCGFSENTELWFSVPSEYSTWFTADVYDAFLVAALYPAMYYGEDIVIEGCVSECLYYNITRYVQNIVCSYRSYMHYVNVSVQGFSKAEQISREVGTGFSAGVDSFTTFYDHYEKEELEEYKISSLFFFNVGSHGGGTANAVKIFNNRYNLLKGFPEEKGLPYIKVNSNLFDYYLDEWEHSAGIFCRAAAILVFQRMVSKYYVSSDCSFKEVMFFNMPKEYGLAAFAETFLNPMLSTDALQIITDGAQYSRIEKTVRIADYPPVRRYLNVCINHWGDYTDAANCGMCGKCMRTLIALESLGKLDDFKDVFDLSLYKKKRQGYLFELMRGYKSDPYYKENVDFAKEHGIKFPSALMVKCWLVVRRVRTFLRRFR